MIGLLCSILILQANIESAQGKWRPLFGENYSEATYSTKAWFHKNGELTATEDEMIWAWGKFENFILRLEFRNEPRTNNWVIGLQTKHGDAAISFRNIRIKEL